MNLANKRKIIASVLSVGANRVWIDPNRIDDIKQAITREDFRGLINEGAIMLKHIQGVSKGRFRNRLIQKRKGRRTGSGSRKGKRTARFSTKGEWILKVRLQRGLINDFRNRKLIEDATYRDLRHKIKGGYFRSARHIKIYLAENNLLKLKNGKK